MTSSSINLINSWQIYIHIYVCIYIYVYIYVENDQDSNHDQQQEVPLGWENVKNHLWSVWLRNRLKVTKMKNYSRESDSKRKATSETLR